MKQIKIDDMTLCRSKSTFSFKEKIEIARKLDMLKVNTIEIPAIENVKTDTLLVRTISSFVKSSVLSIATGMSVEGIDNAYAALSGTLHPRLKIELPLSTVGMEYTCHKKAPKMITFINELVSAASSKCADVEFCAVDATRSEQSFLYEAINTAINAGATTITFCDDAAEIMPDGFAEFLNNVYINVPNLTNVSVGVMCNNKNGLAAASSILAVKGGAVSVKTSVDGETCDLLTFAGIIKNCGNTSGFCTDIKYTELNRTIKQILWIINNTKDLKNETSVSDSNYSNIHIDINDDINAVISAVKQLGYDLSDEDSKKVFEEFKRVAVKKNVGSRELEAIVATTALQVPPTYKLISYVINSGNIISASAQIRLEKDGKQLDGICIGDGPVDASFLTIEKIIGHHYELDDFQIQSVTEGKEAMGSALVKLRYNGKLYSGNGISTDIISAAIRAYINALNKIVYEEV